LKSSLVCFYRELVFKSSVIKIYFDALHGYLVFYNLINLLDCLSYIKNTMIFNEIVTIISENCIVEYIIDKVIDEFS